MSAMRYLLISHQAIRKRKVDQNEEKWKETIHIRYCVYGSICHLDMADTESRCAAGRTEGNSRWFCSIQLLVSQINRSIKCNANINAADKLQNKNWQKLCLFQELLFPNGNLAEDIQV